jgi:hypothetical protein
MHLTTIYLSTTQLRALPLRLSHRCLMFYHVLENLKPSTSAHVEPAPHPDPRSARLDVPARLLLVSSAVPSPRITRTTRVKREADREMYALSVAWYVCCYEIGYQIIWKSQDRKVYAGKCSYRSQTTMLSQSHRYLS